MNLIDFYEDVLKWNFFGGNQLSTDNIENRYLVLVKEESNEIFEGVEEKDHILFLDGLCDTLVVTSFLCAVQKNYKNEILLNDYQIAKQTNNFEFFISELKALKGYVPKKLENESDHLKSLQLIKINSFCILKLVESYIQSFDIDYVGACFEVMRSNWSKYPLVSETNPEFEKHYIESQGRYKNITYTVKTDSEGNDRYIFKDEKNKIVKPSKFSDPDLKPFLTERFLSLEL